MLSVSNLFRQFINLAKTVVYPGFADRPLEKFPDFLQVHIRMSQPNFGDLPELVRQVLQADFLLQQLDVLNLANRRPDGFVQIGRLTVDDAVDGISHIPHDPDILELEQRLMRSDQVQEFDDFLAFLDVEDEPFLPLNTAGIQVKFIGKLDKRLTVLLIHRGDFQVIRRALRVVDRTPCHEGTPKICPLAAIVADNLLVNPWLKQKSFRHNTQLLQNFLNLSRYADDVYIILLQTHFLRTKSSVCAWKCFLIKE